MFLNERWEFWLVDVSIGGREGAIACDSLDSMIPSATTLS